MTAENQILSERQDKSGWYAALPPAVGYDLGQIRLEAAPIFVTIFGALASVYYDFSPEARWSPNVSGSLGFANYADESFFIYSFGSGVSYAFNESWDGTVELRGVGITTADLDIGGFILAPGLGIRYRF